MKEELIYIDLGGDVSNEIRAQTTKIPSEYRGISFSTWLDIFLEYALCLTRIGKSEESYEICEAARDAISYCHSREDMFLIHVTWCSK
jgi:general transcription factor 3C polypeptide 3 (transcription factor C subunit 4)